MTLDPEAGGVPRSTPERRSAVFPKDQNHFRSERTGLHALRSAAPGTPPALALRGMVGFMVLAQRKVLLLAADDFEDMELLYPLYRLVEEDVEVTVAGLG